MTKEAKKTDVNDIDLIAATLTGDIRDFLLDRVKTMGKPFVAMSEDEQREQINTCKNAAENLVSNTVKLIAAEGRKVIVGQFTQLTQKDVIKTVIEFSKSDELRHELFDAQGQAVLLVIAGTEPFTGERAPAEPIPAQSDLIANAEKLKKDDKVTPLKK